MPKLNLNSAPVQAIRNPKAATRQTAAFRDTGDIVARQVKLAYIEPNPYQPRRTFDPQAMAELAADISEHGVLQPILVRPIPGAADDDLTINPDGSPRARYQIIAGERRWRAASTAGKTEIPAVVLENIDDREARFLSLIENVQRQDIEPDDEAQYFISLQNEYNLSQEEIAKQIGKSESYVSRRLSDYKANLLQHKTQTTATTRQPTKDSDKIHKDVQPQGLRVFSQSYIRPIRNFYQYLDKANQQLGDLEAHQKADLRAEIEKMEEQLATFKRTLEDGKTIKK